ncbi:MAG: hypothetical protein ABI846_01165 [Rudaea sp.]
MKLSLFVRAGALAAALACALVASPAPAADPATNAADTDRDGSRDFDFNFGVWKTQIKRKVHPLTTSGETIELSGTVSVRKVWGGRALLEEIETQGPKGPWEGLSLFLYKPGAHQWSQTFIGSKGGAFSGGLIGGFKDGRGELYAADTFDGRAILVRGVWSDVRPTSHRYEESYSADGGKTWDVVLTANKTKQADAVPASALAIKADHDGSHEFDFDLGDWKTHSRRLMHPLSGANDWVELDGGTNVTPIWGGKANLAEFQAQGASGPLELLALRVYNPTTKQWSINFATPKAGALGDAPGIGEARDGRIDFYDQEPINGRATLVRFSIWGISADKAQSEQAFSADGGRTWETNWINQYTRLPR